MISCLPFYLALFLLDVRCALAIPHRTPAAAGQTIPLVRRAWSGRTEDEWGTWARNHKQMLEAKYGISKPSNAAKRSSGTNLLVNQNSDSSYFGSLAIGTPATSFEVILDTGSADLWVADSQCSTGCQNVPTFQSSSSSTFKNTSTPFKITYGSGQAQGNLGRDTVQLAGFSVENQVFGVCDAVSSGLLASPVSGLLGLGWQAIASSGATPFWQTLAANGAWDEPVMAFQLTRFVDNTKADSLEPGGQFTMGFTNSSLYTGDIEYIDVPSGQVSYWILPVTALTVNGASVALDNGTSSSNLAAIDTGTTLVGAPSATIQSLFSQIPGSQPGTGDYEGYYTYPCSTDVTAALSFGGRSWPINPEDFRLAQLNDNTCLGAFFELSASGSAPSWIVGDTFLKNVYSVFRYNPPSVGFAELSSTSNASSTSGPVPTPTIGSAAAIVSATGSLTSDAVGSWRAPSSAWWSALVVAGAAAAGSALLF